MRGTEVRASTRPGAALRRASILPPYTDPGHPLATGLRCLHCG
ncbi:hypothetical protein [Subtercola endophyticus]|nr:hypothetical protein [Subtercola endophyticus]